MRKFTGFRVDKNPYSTVELFQKKDVVRSVLLQQMVKELSGRNDGRIEKCADLQQVPVAGGEIAAVGQHRTGQKLIVIRVFADLLSKRVRGYQFRLDQKQLPDSIQINCTEFGAKFVNDPSVLIQNLLRDGDSELTGLPGFQDAKWRPAEKDAGDEHIGVDDGLQHALLFVSNFGNGIGNVVGLQSGCLSGFSSLGKQTANLLF